MGVTVIVKVFITLLAVSLANHVPASDGFTGASDSATCVVGAVDRQAADSLRAVGLRVTHSPQIIGCGDQLNTSFVIVAYRANGSLCVVVHVPKGNVLTGGACKAVGVRSWSTACQGACLRIVPLGTQKVSVRKAVATAIVAPPMTAADITFRKSGERRRTQSPLLAEVSGNLLKSFGEKQAFTVIASILPGCLHGTVRIKVANEGGIADQYSAQPYASC